MRFEPGDKVILKKAPIKDSIFKTTEIYTVVEYHKRVCKCGDPVVVLKTVTRWNTSCSACGQKFEYPYYNADLFKLINYINPNIEIL